MIITSKPANQHYSPVWYVLMVHIIFFKQSAFGSGLSFGSTSSLFGGFGTPAPGPFGQESTTQGE